MGNISQHLDEMQSSPTTGNLVLILKVVTSDPISSITSSPDLGHPNRFQDFSIALSFHTTLQMSTIADVCPYFLSFHPHSSTWSLPFLSPPAPTPQQNLFSFSLPMESHTSSLEPSFLWTLWVSVIFSLIIAYRVYLSGSGISLRMVVLVLFTCLQISWCHFLLTSV